MNQLQQNINSLEAGIVNIFKMQFDFGWINATDVAGYVQRGLIDAAGYQTITGQTYGQPVNAATPA